MGARLRRASDDTADESTRGKRLQELRLAQRLLAGHGASLLLFDEMEDLLSDPFPAWGLFGPHSRMASRNTGSKVYMQRILEAATTPTLWTEQVADLDKYLVAYNRKRPRQGRRMNSRAPWQAFQEGLSRRPKTNDRAEQEERKAA